MERPVGEKDPKNGRNHTLEMIKPHCKLEGLIVFLDLYWSLTEFWRKREFGKDESDILFQLLGLDLGVKIDLKT